MGTSRVSSKVTVRAIRPHDTTEGYRAPGDEYDRDEAEAKALADRGVLAIVKPKAKAKATR